MTTYQPPDSLLTHFSPRHLADLLPAPPQPRPITLAPLNTFEVFTVQTVTLTKGLTILRPMRLICTATSPNHPQPNPDNPTRRVFP